MAGRSTRSMPSSARGKRSSAVCWCGTPRRLWVGAAPPIWSGQLWSESAQNLVEQSSRSFSRQSQALRAYLERKGSRLVLQGALFLVVLFGLVGARRTLRSLGGDEASHAA